MVTFENEFSDPNSHVMHVRCKKGDAFPINVGDNSDLVEIDPDTNSIKVYFFDKKTGEWIPIE